MSEDRNQELQKEIQSGLNRLDTGHVLMVSLCLITLLLTTNMGVFSIA